VTLEEGVCATHIEREEHYELQVLEESLDCTLIWHCRDQGPFLLESSLEVRV
jgi:riboflavin synthase alpha subunit